MPTLLRPSTASCTPDAVTQQVHHQPGLVLLRSASFDAGAARYSLVAPWPFLRLHISGSRCAFADGTAVWTQFGHPWRVLESVMARFEVLDEPDVPLPLGGCFGIWGYDLKNALEPRLPRHALNDLDLPDAVLGFHDCLLVFDHLERQWWIVSTGLRPDGSRDASWAARRADALESLLEQAAQSMPVERSVPGPRTVQVTSNLSRAEFMAKVNQARAYITRGDIYQVNLSQRLAAPWPDGGWNLFQSLLARSPAPFAAFVVDDDWQLASSSPELFLRMSGARIQTRPIKGTRPRSADPLRDAQLSYELQTSAKEMAELVMITDLLRNDLGRCCEYGTVLVPELVRLERYPQVQHLVSTVEGRLRPEMTHVGALAHCFPGGSVTGAPKIRAMEIIDELEPIARGPYTGCLGYLGFNQESQLSIIIRAAAHKAGWSYFHTGAGIVADSIPEAEYEETVAKAAGWKEALNCPWLERIPHELRGAEE